jgi:formamidopyrimidine-DNA glycosylase
MCIRGRRRNLRAAKKYFSVIPSPVIDYQGSISMMELPEFHVVGRQIDETLTGKEIERVVANFTPRKWAWFNGDPASYNGRLSGKTIGGAVGKDSHIDITFEGSCLSITPPLRYHEDGKDIPKKHQMLLEFSDGSVVSSAIQMWGSYNLYEGEEPADDHPGDMYELRRNDWKPSPLTEDFTKTYFEDLINDEETQKTSVKGMLATKQRIPGVGNGVIQDILWTARLHPRFSVKDLTTDEIDALYKALRGVLGEMTEKGGRDTERDLFWKFGGYRTILSKNTMNDPCPSCGGKIERRSYLGGNVYFCGDCQKL